MPSMSAKTKRGVEAANDHEKSLIFRIIKPFMFFRHGKFRKKNALTLPPRLMGTCRILYREKREADEKNRVKLNTFVFIMMPYS
jgi:hypothetical protein